MTSMTHRLEVRPAEKQRRVAAVLAFVVNQLGQLTALDAERVLHNERVPQMPPALEPIQPVLGWTSTTVVV